MEEKVARPDVLSYGQGHKQGWEDGRKELITEIQAGAVSVAGLIEKARIKERVKIREEIEKELLTGEEIIVALKQIDITPALTKHCTKGEFFYDSLVIVELHNKAIAQAQLDKVLKALES